MKKLNLLAIWVLAAVVAGMAQQTTTPTSAPQTTTPTTAPPTTTPPATGDQVCQPATGEPQKKEIKDPAEYNAYVNATGITDPATRANALEQFIAQYPTSVVKDDALEQLMGAYQQAGNPKALDAAERVWKANPCNVRALVVLAYNTKIRAESENPPNPQTAALAVKYGEAGLQALKTYAKPDPMKPEDFEKFKIIALQVFNGTAGRGSLNNKDYPSAQKYFQAALETELRMDPNDPGQLQNVYPLAIAYLTPKPINVVGLWYIARAVALSQGAAQAEIAKYGKAKYYYYHGDYDGWDQVVAQAATQTTPPPNFTVTPAPTPAEQVKKIAESKDPKQMDFGEWQLIFTYGDQATTDRVWNAIKGVPLQFEAQVLDVKPESLMLAATQDAIDAGKPDVEVTMAVPIPAARMPKVGTSIKLQANPASYDKTPYLMHMDTGKLAVAKPAGHVAPHKPLHHTHK